jgi:hypothetical protein
VVNVNEKLPSVSSAFDLNSLLDEATRMRRVVRIEPSHGGAGLHRDALGGRKLSISTLVSGAEVEITGKLMAAPQGCRPQTGRQGR